MYNGNPDDISNNQRWKNSSVREFGYTQERLEQCRDDKRRSTLPLHITQRPLCTRPPRPLRPQLGFQSQQLCQTRHIHVRKTTKTRLSINEGDAYAPFCETPLRFAPVPVPAPSGREPSLSRSSKMACSRACIAVSCRRVSHSSRVSRFTSRSRRRGRSPLPDEEELG